MRCSLKVAEVYEDFFKKQYTKDGIRCLKSRINKGFFGFSGKYKT